MRDRFAARFGGSCRIFAAPGRVNLIGEHTDYNDGFVMPVAINRRTSVAIAPRADRRLVVYSETIEETAAADLASLAPARRWSDYVFGVAAMLGRSGIELSGACLLVASEVPLGAGLSSSAALEVAVASALLSTVGKALEPVALARLCQRAEHEFVGARVGIMDQFVAVHGRAGQAMLLDCRALDYELIPLPDDVTLVVANTMVRHSVAAGEYNARRVDCEAAVRVIANSWPGVKALRDVTPAQLDDHESRLSDAQWKRARHIVSENERVKSAAAALANRDIDALGLLFAESHRSLRDDFEVSCPELDALVDLAATARGTRAARMTGGGFGGCTVNLVENGAVEEFMATVGRGYEQRLGTRPEFYLCTASNGALEVAEA